MKNKKIFIILAIIFWSAFLALSFVVSDLTSYSGFIQFVLSSIYITTLVLAIVFTIKSKKGNKKFLSKKDVDENILEGRKIYKSLLKQRFKKSLILISICMAIMVIPILIYCFIKADKLYSIILTCSLILGYLIIVFTSYYVGKHFFFPYQELIFNGKTFVLFASRSSFLGRNYDPTFHVVYNNREYTQTGNNRWIGGNDLVDLALTTAYELIDWFSDKKFSNFIRIDVELEEGEKVQCVYKIGRNKFIISKDLDKLSGCFETSRSESLKSKNKK